MRRPVLLLLAVACVGCFTATERYKAKSFTVRDDAVTDADLYAATIRVLDDMGLGTRDKDKDAGIVVSDFAPAGPQGLATMFHAWRIRIEEGKVRIDIDCALHDRSLGTQSCGPGRAEEWVRLVPELAQKISDDAWSRAQKRRAREAADEAAKKSVNAVANEGSE